MLFIDGGRVLELVIRRMMDGRVSVEKFHPIFCFEICRNINAS